MNLPRSLWKHVPFFFFISIFCFMCSWCFALYLFTCVSSTPHGVATARSWSRCTERCTDSCVTHRWGWERLMPPATPVWPSISRSGDFPPSSCESFCGCGHRCGYRRGVGYVRVRMRNISATQCSDVVQHFEISEFSTIKLWVSVVVGVDTGAGTGLGVVCESKDEEDQCYLVFWCVA